MDDQDEITDFQASGREHDVIDLRDFGLSFTALRAMMVQSGKDVMITLPTHVEITLDHVDLADLKQDDFLL
jgi:hypothetical protein